jgi:UDP-N-acetylmuramoylalanine--D-glutamate ligase
MNRKHVVIVGAARQGLALARYLALHGTPVVLTDQRSEDDLRPARQSLADLEDMVQWALGGHPFSLLDGARMVCLSGGVSPQLPLAQEAVRQGIPLSNDSQIFLEAAPCPTLGITGSAGKTTTTSLVGLMAQESARLRAEGFQGALPELSKLPQQAWVGGNIGSPLIATLDEMQPGDLAVMELSSFQLELMTRSPQVAAILNITPNHLDRHGTMAAYTAAKQRILEFQAPQDVAVLGRMDPGAWALRQHVHGRLFSFGLDEPPTGEAGAFLKGEHLTMQIPTSTGWAQVPILSRQSIHLRGQHNLLNVLAAIAIGAAAGLPPQAMQAAVADFWGVPHRLEFVRQWRGAQWYNNSIATAPERTIAAIRSFDEPLLLLVGGRDKDLPWEELARLAWQRVDHLIVFGEAAEKILQALEAVRLELPPASQRMQVRRCASLREAVLEAARIVQPGEVVLLSPGGTSFDEFRDFEERGTCYAQWVRELPDS